MSEDKYAAIRHLSRPVSDYPRMSAMARAAQFSPFAALNGHAEAIDETSRLTERYIELTNDEKLSINNKINYINEHLNTEQTYEFVYFEPDETKQGGRYITKTGKVKHIDEYNECIILKDKSQIAIPYLVAIEADIFNKFLFEDELDSEID